MKHFSLFCWLFISCTLVYSQTGPAAFLPEKDDLPGWRLTAEPKIFRVENLYDLVKEDYKLIMEYGFDNAVSASYYNFQGQDMYIQVFTMESTFGSCGLFLRNSRDAETLKDFGNATYRKTNEYGFWKHFYFIRMTSRFSGDTINEGFRQLAGFIDARIRTRGQSPSILDYSKDKSGNIIIFKGPLALSEIYYFSPLNVFFANEGIAIIDKDKTELIFTYTDNNEAVRRFTEVAGIVSQMSKFSNFVMPAPFSFAMMDKAGKMLTFKVAENRINVVIK